MKKIKGAVFCKLLNELHSKAQLVEITVGRRLKPTKSRNQPTNKISENPIITDRFYCLLSLV